jgi:hypothetical protein
MYNLSTFSELVIAYRTSWVEQHNVARVRINLFLWTLLLITNVIDLIVSYSLFSHGAVEMNPAMSILCSQFGNISLAFYKGFLLGALFILLPYIKNKLQYLLLSTCSVYIVLVVSHMIRFQIG